MRKILITLLFFIPHLLLAVDIPLKYMGKWQPASASITRGYGELTVTKNTVSFAKLDSYSVVVISTADDSAILELPSNYPHDCGRYIRLGPIAPENIGGVTPGELNFTSYRNKEDALLPISKISNPPETHIFESAGECGWGFYER